MSRPIPVDPPLSWCALVVAVAALLVYAGALHNGFAYDDVALVQHDPRIRALSNGGDIFTSGYWREEEQGLYRPLTTFSFAVDWSLAPASAAWFHFTNVLWHAAASVLVFLLLAHFVAPAAALAGGLVFALHPVHVEAVANVVGRAEPIAATFALSAALLWLHRPSDRRRRIVADAAVPALFALALLAKESAAVLPALLVLLDAARGALRPSSLRAYLSDRGRALGGLVLVLLAFLVLRLAILGQLAPTRLDAALEVTDSNGERVLTALQLWPVYLRLLLWPHPLLADYGPRVLGPAGTLTPAAAAGAILLAGSAAAGVVAWLRGRNLVALALLWFPLTILPVSNLIVPIGVLLAERTLYLPSIALSIAVAAVAAAVLDARARRPRAVSLATVALTLAVVLMAARTAVRVPEWRSTDRIMMALVRDRPDSFRAHWHLARLARQSGDESAAQERYDRALELWPHRSRLVIEAATFAAQTGAIHRTYELAAHAARSWPDDLNAHRLLAGAALDLGDTATARLAMHAGLRLSPRDAMLTRMRAVLTTTPTTKQP